MSDDYWGHKDVVASWADVDQRAEREYQREKAGESDEPEENLVDALLDYSRGDTDNLMDRAAARIAELEMCLDMEGAMLHAAREHIAELEAVVEKLPVDATGRRVVPGDVVYHPNQNADYGLTVTAGEEGGAGPQHDGWFVTVPVQREGGFVTKSIEANIDECYPTRAAAEAALAKREGGGDA